MQTTHRDAAAQYIMGKRPAELLSKFGVRYSSLLELPYFINAQLVAKHGMQVWTN